jgi:hypothetical protein
MITHIEVMGITLGDPKSFFACKFAKLCRVLTATPAEKVATSTMRNCCKDLISAAGLDPTEYATHSSKRGGALQAMRMGFLTLKSKSWVVGQALPWLLSTPAETRRCEQP